MSNDMENIELRNAAMTAAHELNLDGKFNVSRRNADAVLALLAAAGVSVVEQGRGWYSVAAGQKRSGVAALKAAAALKNKQVTRTFKSGADIADWVKDSLGLDGGQYGHYTVAEYTAADGESYYANMTIRVADHNMNPANNRGAGVLSIVCQDDASEVGKFKGAGFYAQAHLNPGMTKREMMAEIERAFKFVAGIEIAELEKEVNRAGVAITSKVVVDRVKDIRKLA